jgi:hypothetical protein
MTRALSRRPDITSAAANREPAAVVALEHLVLGLERPHKHRGPLGLGPASDAEFVLERGNPAEPGLRC